MQFISLTRVQTAMAFDEYHSRKLMRLKMK